VRFTGRVGARPSGLAVFDASGDGVPDLVVGNQFGDVLVLYGNGDGTFDLTEQKRASDALYNIVRGSYNFLGQPRRLRLGFEVNF
jgi:hypothetical protein